MASATFSRTHLTAVIASIVLVLGTPTGLAAQVPPTVVHVDAAFDSLHAGGHVWGVDAFATIQKGIDAVDVGGVVYVAQGSYVEQLLIQKSMQIIGAGRDLVTVLAPDSGRVLVSTYYADDEWLGDYLMADFLLAVVSPGGTAAPISVKVSGLTLDMNQQPNLGDRVIGVHFRNISSPVRSDAGLAHCRIRGFQNLDPWTMAPSTGIQVIENSNLAIDDCELLDYADGILVHGTSNLPDPRVTISGCALTPPFAGYGNGIQGHWLNDSTNTLTITGNIFGAHELAIGGWRSDHFTITGNTITGSILPVAMDRVPYSTVSNNVMSDFSTNGIMARASSSTFSGNTIVGGSDCYGGIYLYSSVGCTISNNAISDIRYSVFTGTEADVDAGNAGWGIGLDEGSNNAVITGNTISACDVAVENWSGSGTVLSGNALQDCFHGIHNATASTITATSNWWGDPTGPTVAANTCGAGLPVSDRVTYAPWYRDAAMSMAISMNSFDVGGQVVYLNTAATALDGVKVNLHQGTTLIGTTTTSGTGEFEFADVLPGSYTLSLQTAHASGNWQTWGGVNAVDYLAVARHVANAPQLAATPALIRIAADVKAPASPSIISLADATMIRAAYLANSPAGFDIPRWVFTRGMDPGERGVPGTIPYNSPSATEFTVTVGCDALRDTYHGLCAGDVNGSYQPGGGLKKAALSESVELVEDGILQPDMEGKVTVPIRASAAMEVGAMSLAFRLPEGARLVDAVIAGMNAAGMDAGDEICGAADRPDIIHRADRIECHWVPVNGRRFEAGETVFALRLVMDPSLSADTPFMVRLSDEISSEVADPMGTVIPGVRLLAAKVGGGASALELSVFPHPVENRATVSYTLSQASHVHITLHDLLGREVLDVVNVDLPAGRHKAVITPAMLSAGTSLLRMTVQSMDGRVERRQTLVFTR